MIAIYAILAWAGTSALITAACIREMRAAERARQQRDRLRWLIAQRPRQGP